MYDPKLNPKRGLMIEKSQLLTNLDLDLARRVLNENDELIYVIGDATRSHDPGNLMTGGERVEVVSHVFKESGLDPNRFMVIPVENFAVNLDWVVNVNMCVPKWDTFYTRNFKNGEMFKSLYNLPLDKRVEFISEQRVDQINPNFDPHKIYFESLIGNTGSIDYIAENVPAPALDMMHELCIDERAKVIYGHMKPNPDRVVPMNINRVFMVGRFGPLTGKYEERNGHLGAFRQILDKHDEFIIGNGTAQASEELKNPQTVGEKIDVERYALMKAGISGSRLFYAPIRDSVENSLFPIKVMALTPRFSGIYTGNDLVRIPFEMRGKNVYQLERSESSDGIPISASLVRDITGKALSQYETLDDKAINECEKQLQPYMSRDVLDKLRTTNYHVVMKSLYGAKE